MSWFLLASCLVLFGSIIKFPPGKGTEMVAYQQLACSQEDRDRIRELISTLAERNKMSLLFQQGHLKRLGVQLAHVHPLKFLGVIFSDEYLKSCMADIFDDGFKKDGFLSGSGEMAGITASLTREAEKGSIQSYLKDFCAEVHVEASSIQSYIDARDWEGMIAFLIRGQ